MSVAHSSPWECQHGCVGYGMPTSVDLGLVAELQSVFSSVCGARTNSYLVGLSEGFKKYIKVLRTVLGTEPALSIFTRYYHVFLPKDTVV